VSRFFKKFLLFFKLAETMTVKGGKMGVNYTLTPLPEYKRGGDVFNEYLRFFCIAFLAWLMLFF
jgi:hypothetical protein